MTECIFRILPYTSPVEWDFLKDGAPIRKKPKKPAKKKKSRMVGKERSDGESSGGEGGEDEAPPPSPPLPEGDQTRVMDDLFGREGDKE